MIVVGCSRNSAFPRVLSLGKGPITTKTKKTKYRQVETSKKIQILFTGLSENYYLLGFWSSSCFLGTEDWNFAMFLCNCEHGGLDYLHRSKLPVEWLKPMGTMTVVSPMSLIGSLSRSRLLDLVGPLDPTRKLAAREPMDSLCPSD